MKIGEFFVQIGVNADSKTLNQFVGDLGDLHLSTLANIGSITALVAELVKLGTEATNAAVGFQLFKNETGLSSQELQRWQIVAQQANVSAESVASSVVALQKNLANIRFGRGNISPFQMLGIGVQGNAFDVLRQLRSRIQGLDNATAVNIIEQMGLTPDMINVLKLSNVEFEKLSRTTSGMTTKQEKQFLKLKLSLEQLQLQFKYLAFESISRFLTVFEKFMDYMHQSEGALTLLRSSFILLGAAITLALGSFVAPFALLFLFLDDLAGYFAGDDSLIGRGIEGFKKLGEEFKKSFNIPNFTNLLNALSGSGGLGLAGLIGSGAVAGAKSMANTFNINVTGQGSAVDIANEVARQVGKMFGKSEKEFNNGPN